MPTNNPTDVGPTLAQTVANAAAIAVLDAEVLDVERHQHRRSRVLGAKAAPVGTTGYATNDLTNMFEAYSGASDWGAPVTILGVDDTPQIPGYVSFDPGELSIVHLGNTDEYGVRVIWGDTWTNGIAANQYSEVMIKSDIAKVQVGGGVPLKIGAEKCTAGACKLFVQIWSINNGSTVGFFLDEHEYPV